MKDNTVVAKEYTDWLVKTGGYARDMTMRDHFAGLAMQGMYANGSFPTGFRLDTAKEAYEMADAMLKERNK